MIKGLRIGLACLAMVTVLNGWAQADSVNYELLQKVLTTYINDEGQVNYDGLKANREPLDRFIAEQVENKDIVDFSDSEKKAFWINAYNALTLRLIVDNYPLRFGGIRTINWGRPWSIKFKAAGRKVTLGDIEHEILRKWDPIDPRIHFAINCASIGCPKIPNTYFDPQRLDAQLDHEARRFVNDKEKVELNRAKNMLYHSAIFDWFEDDFLATDDNLKSYILRYLNDEDKQYITDNNVNLKTLKYDWGLNKQ